MQLAPDGVRIQRLGDVGTFIRGRRFTKADRVDEGLPSIHYGEIYTHYGVSASEARSHVRIDMAPALRFAEPGEVVIAAVGETVEDVGKAVAWLGSERVAVHDDCFIYRSSLDPKYVAYFTQSAAFNKPKEPLVSRAKVKRLSSEGLATLFIPTPPLEVQREIVAVLDRFTHLGSGLNVALEAEIEARRSQYEHYRRKLVDGLTAEPVPLSSLGRWFGGITPSKSNAAYWDSGNIPWLASMDVSDETTDEIRGRVTSAALRETSLRLIPAPSVAVVMRSNILRRRLPIGLISVDTTVNQDMRMLVPREGVDADYVFQLLRADAEPIRKSCVRTDGSMAAVDSTRFFAWQIPLPPLVEQRRIAETLRNFDALVSGLTGELIAELRARRDQYEYYRDNLFAVEEVVA